MTGVRTYHARGNRTIWRIYVTPPGGQTVDITKFRGVPTQIGNLSYSDPFSDATASFSLPAVTGLDRPGTGDLAWLVPFSNVDIIEYDADTALPTGMNWEGFYVSEDQSEAGLTCQCQGALFQLDAILAKPTFPTQPIPYEHVIADAFDPDLHPDLRTSPMKVEWPADWDEVVPEFPEDLPGFLRPWGVSTGERWSGLVTRTTGSWEPSLTGLVQSLLSMMHTAKGGKWTIRKDPGRVPVLHVREPVWVPYEGILEVWYGVHGVEVSLSRDWSQSANVIYATGTDLAGSSFSGMQVTADGAGTYYEPFSASPQVYPAADSNHKLIPAMMRRETQISLPQGVDSAAGRDVAYSHLRKSNDPGYTGTITLRIDPVSDGEPSSRMHIKAGQSILLRGFRGTNLLLHISKSDIDIEQQVVTLTVDSKYRDLLTIQEVQARTRDSLDPVRLLQVGRYSNTVQDLILPWSYEDGSGILPSGGGSDAKELFTKLMDDNAKFPWTDWTTKYPPKDYPQFYVKVGPASTNANDNWAGAKRGEADATAIPIRMSQAGEIRLSQIAAYDEDGNIMPIRFHVGIYSMMGVNYTSMPTVPAGGYDGYAAGQRYPFFPGAFENIRADGTEQDNLNYLPASNIGMVIAWGNYYEPAGHSPGMASRGAEPTGQLIDETNWTFDTTNQTEFDKYSVENTRKATTAGLLYALIYADDQGDQPVYFLGRFTRSEPTG